eukprot:EST46991.1 Hypothetical protein SS50377_12943 [Spironucleus salmonicida]
MHTYISQASQVYDTFRKLKVINQAILNLSSDDLFQQVKRLFPSVFGFARNSEQISLHPSQLFKIFANALIDEAFVNQRYTGRSVQMIKDLLQHISITHKIDFSYVEEYADLLVFNAGKIDVFKSYTQLYFIISLLGVKFGDIMDRGSKLEMRQFDGIIHDFWRAMEHNQLLILNQPLFLGSKCVVLSRFFESDNGDIVEMQNGSIQIKSGLMNDQFRKNSIGSYETMTYQGMKSKLLEDRDFGDELRTTQLKMPNQSSQISELLKLMRDMQQQINKLQNDVEELKVLKNYYQ